MRRGFVAGKPIARYALDTALEVGAEETVFVIGRNSDEIRETLGEDRIQYAYQTERKGTGHAAMQARSVLEGRSDMVLVCYADMPLLKAKKAIGKMKSAQILEILGTDPGTRNDLPAFTERAGHEYLGEKEDEGFIRFYIKVK